MLIEFSFLSWKMTGAVGATQDGSDVHVFYELDNSGIIIEWFSFSYHQVQVGNGKNMCIESE